MRSMDALISALANANLLDASEIPWSLLNRALRSLKVVRKHIPPGFSHP